MVQAIVGSVAISIIGSILLIFGAGIAAILRRLV